MDDFPVVVRLPVLWGDMDAYGHVNNTVFFRFFEVARIAYLERCGLLDSMNTQGIGAILHSTACRFRKPVKFPDQVIVGARVTEISDDRFTHEYRVFSVKLNDVAAEGHGIVVTFDYEKGVKTVIPEVVRDALHTIENQSSP